MQTLTVGLEGRAYPIHVGPGLLMRAAEFVAPLQASAVLVVTDANVGARYGMVLAASLQSVARTAVHTMAAGEPSKTMAGVAAIQDALIELGADRRSVVVALGGGVVGDLAGFAAAIYMRGIRFVQMPTTLLAQVDSSVGGKTGVNHPRGKNLIGAFHQPAAVLADTDTLRTLPPRELSAGLAEVLKHGLLADAAYLAQTERDLPALRALDAEALTRAIVGSCAIKAGIVARDERESGERALLNLGHTFGHAIEALTGYGRWLHGEAVGCGLCLAADLSNRLGYLGAADMDRIAAGVAAAGLPVRIAGLSRAAAFSAMRSDKKAERGEIGFIVLERIGRAIQRRVPDALVEQTLAAGGYV